MKPNSILKPKLQRSNDPPTSEEKKNKNKNFQGNGLIEQEQKFSLEMVRDMIDMKQNPIRDVYEMNKLEAKK